MMLFQFIPFFLAAQLDGNFTWEYGPEYEFSGYLKMITSLEQDMDKPLGTGVYFNLNCRPRERDTLRCHITNSTITRLELQAFSVDDAEPALNDKYRAINIIKMPFEIKFGEKGIENFVVERTDPEISSWSLNEIRLIANQLSIGIDLSDGIISNYKSWENFTIGECQVDFIITRQPNIQSHEEKHRKEFELSALDKLGRLANESILVQKKRNVKDCLRCTQPFFGTRYTLGLLLRDVLTKLVTSESKIIISKYTFVSETINESDVYDQDRKKLGKVLDHMKLTLESVGPAQNSMPKFSNPFSRDMLLQVADDNSA